MSYRVCNDKLPINVINSGTYININVNNIFNGTHGIFQHFSNACKTRNLNPIPSELFDSSKKKLTDAIKSVN